MARYKNITQQELKEYLDYNPDTGEWTWIKTKSNAAKAGTKPKYRSDGYLKIRFNGQLFRSARLAFLYMEGYLPEHNIDHIDRDPTNDKWKNLREANQSCNMKNASMRKDNKSGVIGVCKYSGRKRWLAFICKNGKTINLGSYKEFIDAVRSRWKAEVKNNYPNCRTDSSAYKYLNDNIKRVKA